MNFKEYKNCIKQIKIGKQLPDAIYLHDTALENIPDSLLFFFNQTIKNQNLEKVSWNIIKFFCLVILNYIRGEKDKTSIKKAIILKSSPESGGIRIS